MNTTTTDTRAMSAKNYAAYAVARWHVFCASGQYVNDRIYLNRAMREGIVFG